MKTHTNPDGKVQYVLELGDSCPHCGKAKLVKHLHVSDQFDCRNCGTVGPTEAKENFK